MLKKDCQADEISTCPRCGLKIKTIKDFRCPRCNKLLLKKCLECNKCNFNI